MQTNVLLLGDPRLREKAARVSLPPDTQRCRENEPLQKALEAFRAEKGFGRAIAAPQIGISKRVIALHLEGKTFSIFNPAITSHSEETFLLWDDCMSFPDLLVKVRRYTSISIVYQDALGREHRWENLDRSRSELLQHEIDHLDGILAIDRAIDQKSVIYRSVFEENKPYFVRQVD
ncbi:peptide deformylase [Sediminispirochaeta bajacaliforniensis]|uniref:peptide deformylase n=1 Tax=Sediminispirochaeta bajacaliforniensis TaxID=148 RepID=UPI0003814794|nr:peptide deformylase [Sediminispirochaeta bajacaliforniensis]